MAGETTSGTTKPAAKRRARKPAAARTTTAKRARTRTTVKAQDRRDAAKLLESVGSAETLHDLNLRLASVVAGSSMTTGESGMTSEADGSGRPGGLTLEEISNLLRQREASGYHKGSREAWSAARRDFAIRMQRERAEAVAGALTMVTQQLEALLHDLAAAADKERQANGRLALVVLVKELGRVADRLVGSDGEPAF